MCCYCSSAHSSTRAQRTTSLTKWFAMVRQKWKKHSRSWVSSPGSTPYPSWFSRACGWSSHAWLWASLWSYSLKVLLRRLTELQSSSASGFIRSACCRWQWYFRTFSRTPSSSIWSSMSSSSFQQVSQWPQLSLQARLEHPTIGFSICSSCPTCLGRSFLLILSIKAILNTSRPILY